MPWPRDVARRIRQAPETSDAGSWRLSSERQGPWQWPGLYVGDETLGVLEEGVVLRTGGADLEPVHVLRLGARRVPVAAEAEPAREPARGHDPDLDVVVPQESGARDEAMAVHVEQHGAGIDRRGLRAELGALEKRRDVGVQLGGAPA